MIADYQIADNEVTLSFTFQMYKSTFVYISNVWVREKFVNFYLEN